MMLLKRISHILKALIKRYFDYDAGKNAAALAYYLIFSIFPLLIFVSNLLGWLQLDVYTVAQLAGRLLPQDITALLMAYLQHINENYSPGLLWFSLVFSVWFLYRAVKGLIKDVRAAYGLGRPANRLRHNLLTVSYTVLLLLALMVSLLVIITGHRVLVKLFSLLPVSVAQIFYLALPLWGRLRAIIATAVMYMAIVMLYSLSVERRQSVAEVLPGAVASLMAWLAASMAFSWYVENIAGYSVIYGALGAVMALLIWLYLSAIILIMGAHINGMVKDIENSYR